MFTQNRDSCFQFPVSRAALRAPLPDRRRISNKTTLTLTLSRPTGEGTARLVSRSSKAVGYADRRRPILPLPSDPVCAGGFAEALGPGPGLRRAAAVAP